MLRGVVWLTLERELPGHPHIARAGAERRRVAAARCFRARDLPEAAGVANRKSAGSAWVAEVWCVRETECLNLKHQAHMFMNREGAAEAHIQVEQARPAEFISARCAEYRAARPGDRTRGRAAYHRVEIGRVEVCASRIRVGACGSRHRAWVVVELDRRDQ